MGTGVDQAVGHTCTLARNSCTVLLACCTALDTVVVKSVHVPQLAQAVTVSAPNPNGSVSTTMVTEYAPTATAMTRSPWKRPHCNTGPRVHLKSSICLSREFSRSMWSSSFSNPRPRPLPSFVFVDLRCCSRPGVWQVSHWPFASKPLLLHMIRLQLARVIIKGRQTSYSVPLSTVLYV